MQITKIVPQFLSESQREQIGRDIIRTIRRRTISGLDINGAPFAGYSDRYINSKEFAQAGKSAGSVDLRFTREMLNSMVVQDTSPGLVTIGFDSSSAAEKAEWSHASDNGPSREFFDISDSELEDILSSYDVPEDLPDRVSAGFLSRFLSIGN